MDNEQKIIKLLEDMEKSNRKQAAYARLQFIFSVVTVLCCVVILISVLKVIPVVQDVASQAVSVISNLEAVTEDLAKSDLLSIVEDMDDLVSNVDGLVTTSQAGVEQALQKINSIDFDSLNGAIKDLSDVIEPIAKFFNRNR